MVLFSPTHTFSQNSVGNMDTPIFYDAEDSIVGDIPNQIVRLYGNGIVKYDDITLTADVIEVNLKTNEVTATYSKDSLGNKVGKPIFTQGAEEIQCESIKYNFNTEKGYITETRTTQGEGYIHMAETKRQPNGEIHFKDGKYTTCDKEHPHYHFQLSKAIVVPEKRIVTGPMYMKILNVPLPIAAPFAILPNSDTKTHGFLMPTLALGSQYGSGLQNLGYYTPIGEYWETYLYGTIYTSGRWSLENTTNYYKNYKSKGTISLGYSHLSGYFYEDDITNNLQIKWSHTQDAKAHPSLKFNSSINFVSNNNPKSDIDIISDNYYDNQMLSSATLSKSWKLGQFSGSWTTKASMQQYSTTETYTMQLPSFNLNVSRFDLGVLRKNSVGKKWYENIYVTYTLNSANSITSPDSIFNKTYYPLVSDYLLNGVKQNAVIQTNLKPKSGWFTFNLSSTYNELWNFQTYEKYWNDTESRVDTNDFNGFQSGRYINFSGGLSTNLYGYYKSPNQNVKARHVMSPNVTFTYRPDISQYTEYQSDSLGNTAYYSPFDVSLYQESSRGESGLISYSLGNTLDLKTRNKKDSINRSYKSTSLISQLNIGGSYDIFADSMKLSDFTMSLRSSPVSNISIQTGARLSPYSYDTLGNEYDKYCLEQSTRYWSYYKCKHGYYC